MAKIKLHNLVPVSDQVFFTLQLEEKKAEFLPSILYALREEGISLSFFGQFTARNRSFTLLLATAEKDADWVRVALQEGLDFVPPTPLEVRKEVALITLYGPHFGEIPGIASRILSALTADAVEVLAWSASLNSSLLVIPMESLAQSLRALNRIFEIPPK